MLNCGTAAAEPSRASEARDNIFVVVAMRLGLKRGLEKMLGLREKLYQLYKRESSVVTDFGNKS